MASDIMEITMLDYAGRLSRVKVYIPEVDDVFLGTIGTMYSNIAASGLLFAIDTLSKCEVVSAHVITKETDFVKSAITDVDAQVSTGLRVMYQDTVNAKKYHLTIPAPELTNIAQPDTEYVNITVAPMSTWVTAFEAFAKSPDGNAVNVTGARIIGRRR